MALVSLDWLDESLLLKKLQRGTGFYYYFVVID
jgi:hypothetical protein